MSDESENVPAPQQLPHDRLVMKILFFGVQSSIYTVPIIKVQEYTVEEIFENLDK